MRYRTNCMLLWCICSLLILSVECEHDPLLTGRMGLRWLGGMEVRCKYVMGSILLDEGDGQTMRAKHLCLAASDSDPEGKPGMVYLVPKEVVTSIGVDDLISGVTQFVINGARIARYNNFDDRIVLTKSWSVVVTSKADRSLFEANQFNVTGTQSLVVARVTATDSSVSRSAEELQDAYFASKKSSVAVQYDLCSAGQYTLTPGANANGVVEIPWNVISSGVNIEDMIENSLRAAFESAYGSPGQYGHVIYCLPSGVNTFRGYTYPGTNEIWLHDKWCASLSLPFHEIGHNLGLKHSNAADGTAYEDRSCMMGVSYSHSFAPSQCFNGHKFWILNWFSSYRTVVNPAIDGPISFDVAAFVDARKLPASSLVSSTPYMVLINVGDLYLVYNLAKEFNVGVQGSPNQVSITRAPSFLSSSIAVGGIDANNQMLSAVADLGNGSERVVFEFCETKKDTIIESMRISIRTESQSKSCTVLPHNSGESLIQQELPSPSASPSNLATAFPSASNLICDDKDGEFFVQDLNSTKNCIWLRARPELIPRACTEEAKVVCPETCGACSDNCEDSEQVFVVNGAFRDCAWLSIRPGQQAALCDVGKAAYFICPETCNACDGRSDLSDIPSSSPSSRDSEFPSTFQSTSGAPTQALACDDDPVRKFRVESLGTDAPCIWLHSRPEYQTELCVEGNPAYDICEETCGKCTDDCNDTAGTFAIGGVPRDCAWLLLRPDIQAIVCVFGSEAFDVCPETCNACDGAKTPTTSPTTSTSPICDDDPNATFSVPSLGTNEPCIWLASRPSFKEELCQEGTSAYNLCAETCGKCVDTCEDTGGTFKYENIQRDCEWLRLRLGIQQVVCVPGNDAFDLVCPETCNACDGDQDPQNFPSPSLNPMTVSPSERSNGPSNSYHPSMVPSSLPTESFQPSKLPSYRPTTPPSVVSSTAPSSPSPTRDNICDDDPNGSFFVASLGTSEPCIWLADRPDFFSEVCVEGHPAYDICEETCGKCSDNCTDTFAKFAISGVERDCEWLRLRSGIQAVACGPDSDASIACPETCNVCDGHITPSTSVSPTQVPSTYLSDLPSSIPSVNIPPSAPTPRPTTLGCDDDMDSTFPVASIGGTFPSISPDEYQGCLWLSSRPVFQILLCDPLDPSGAYDVCEETCGKCKDNCEDTDGTFDVDGVTRDCDWLILRSNYQASLCSEGSDVRNICPETCNACDGTMPPSSAPSEAPVSPSASPTTMTTSYAPALVLCDDTNGDFMSDITGNREPCIWLQARPEYVSQTCTEGSEASVVCPETCGACQDECEDTDRSFMVDGIARDCAYLRVRASLISFMCVKGKDAYDVCPETCGACDGSIIVAPSPSAAPVLLCDDTDQFFFVSATGTREPCIWLQARPEYVSELCSTGSEASLACPETCGACQDDCEDTDKKFLVDSNYRDCGWLRIRPGQQSVLCREGSEAYAACPETCNSCR